MLLRSALALMLAAALPAAASGESIDLQWNDGNGPDHQSFSCNSNSGTLVLVPTFRAPTGLTQFVGTYTIVELMSDGSSLPDWWRGAIGECRAGAFVASDPGAMGLSGGFNPFENTGLFQGIVGYVTGPNGDPRRAQIRFDSVRSEPFPATIASGTRAIAGALEIRAARTVGGAACTGCARSVCLLVKQITLYQASGTSPSDTIELSDGGMSPSMVVWQDGAVSGCSSPARNRTWGEVKSLYR